MQLKNNRMKDKLVICRKCGGNACYESKVEDIISWSCMGCGFSSHTLLSEGSDYQQQHESTLPQLYLDLKFIDIENRAWYPITLNFPENGILFANGSSIQDWRWTAMLAIKIKDEEKSKFKKPGTIDEYFTHKMDATTVKHFGANDFMDGAEYTGVFKR